MMARGTNGTLRNLRLLFRGGSVAGYPDAQLIEQFLARQGEGEVAEAAFSALVERHGPMVLGVCRRILTDPRDAEDAFQATFLILARKAGSVRVGNSLGRWLYGVSRRVASRVRAGGRERDFETLGDVPDAAEARADRLELRSVIDEELGRLPAKYRDPIVLCYLEGRTHEGAARQLGWPVGTVRGRLARARDLLRSRLSRRGVAPSVALLSATASAGAAVPSMLVDMTTRAACRAVAGRGIAVAASARVADWAACELASMAMPAWKAAAGLLLVAGTLCAGAAFGSGSPQAVSPAQHAPDPKAAVGAVADDRGEIVGIWTSEDEVTETVGGIPKPPRRVTTRWVISADKISMADGDGFLAHEMRYTLDPTATPRAIDLTVTASGAVMVGIYQLEGDELSLAYGLSRPKDFKEGPAHMLHKLKRESRTPRLLSSRFELAPGCQWAIAPGGAMPSSMGGGGIHAMVEKGADGALGIVLAYMRKGGPKPGPELRPVVFDAKGKRYMLKSGEGGANNSIGVPGVMLYQMKYRLDPAALPADGAAALGIEAVPSDVQRASREGESAQSIAKARARGIDLLPWPRVGEPYDFTLKTSDGRVLRSHDLKGKVVLIDCWATWCSPCMAKMPRLKELYEKHHGDGLEIIGLNFDHDPAHARRSIATLGLPWAEVFVPTDEPTRELWETAAGIESLPRLLLLDRSGVLRYDGGPAEIEEQIAKSLRSRQL
jgi:RNA polymerase sigma factor (sigma-70 family)